MRLIWTDIWSLLFHVFLVACAIYLLCHIHIIPLSLAYPLLTSHLHNTNPRPLSAWGEVPKQNRCLLLRKRHRTVTFSSYFLLRLWKLEMMWVCVNSLHSWSRSQHRNPGNTLIDGENSPRRLTRRGWTNRNWSQAFSNKKKWPYRKRSRTLRGDLFKHKSWSWLSLVWEILAKRADRSALNCLDAEAKIKHWDLWFAGAIRVAQRCGNYLSNQTGRKDADRRQGKDAGGAKTSN